CRQNRCCKNGSDHRFRFLRCPHQESRFFRSLSVALVVCVLLAVLNRFTNPQYYWSGWVALIWGALLVVRGLRLFVFGEWIKNWRQARLQRLLRK
ncbi:2TM domain-containing protein, partial [Klebsiella pneumoniae]